MLEGENQLSEVVFWLPCACCGMSPPPPPNKQQQERHLIWFSRVEDFLSCSTYYGNARKKYFTLHLSSDKTVTEIRGGINTEQVPTSWIILYPYLLIRLNYLQGWLLCVWQASHIVTWLSWNIFCRQAVLKPWVIPSSASHVLGLWAYAARPE